MSIVGTRPPLIGEVSEYELHHRARLNMNYTSKEIRWIKIRLFTIGSGWKRAAYLKKKKVFMHMGERCYYHTRDLPSEPYLVKLHNDVRIASGSI